MTIVLSKLRDPRTHQRAVTS